MQIISNTMATGYTVAYDTAGALLSVMDDTAAKPGVLVIAPVSVPIMVKKFILLKTRATLTVKTIGSSVISAPITNSLMPYVS